MILSMFHWPERNRWTRGVLIVVAQAIVGTLASRSLDLVLSNQVSRDVGIALIWVAVIAAGGLYFVSLGTSRLESVIEELRSLNLSNPEGLVDMPNGRTAQPAGRYREILTPGIVSSGEASPLRSREHVNDAIGESSADKIRHIFQEVYPIRAEIGRLARQEFGDRYGIDFNDLESFFEFRPRAHGDVEVVPTELTTSLFSPAPTTSDQSQATSPG
jgi:hypothetical protein